MYGVIVVFFFFFQAEDGIRDYKVTGVQTCALPISSPTVTSTRSLQFKCPRNETTRAVAQVLLTVSGSLSLGVDDRGGGVICQHPCLTRVVRASRFTPPFPAAVVLHPGVQ